METSNRGAITGAGDAGGVMGIGGRYYYDARGACGGAQMLVSDWGPVSALVDNGRTDVCAGFTVNEGSGPGTHQGIACVVLSVSQVRDLREHCDRLIESYNKENS